MELKQDRDISTWALAGELEQALARYAPAHGQRPRDKLPALQCALHDVFSAGCAMKRSRKRIFDLLPT